MNPKYDLAKRVGLKVSGSLNALISWVKTNASEEEHQAFLRWVLRVAELLGEEPDLTAFTAEERVGLRVTIAPGSNDSEILAPLGVRVPPSLVNVWILALADLCPDEFAWIVDAE